MNLTKSLQRATEVWQMWRISYGMMNLIKVLQSVQSILKSFSYCAQRYRDFVVFMFVKLSAIGRIMALATQSRSLMPMLNKPL